MANNKNIGKVIQVIGPVLDIEFKDGNLPAIYNSLEIEIKGKDKIVAETAQHLGDNIVKAIALSST